MRLLEALQTALRAAKVPGSVAAKVIAEAESVLETYRVQSDRELLELPDWNLWLLVNKSLLSRLTRLLRSEGFCHANSFVISAVMLLDERIAELVREWVKSKCSSGNDPCCKNPRCCNIA